jgi:sarcosine oxidase
MIQRAYDLWHELESEAGRQLFFRTGGLMIGKPESAVVAGARRSAEEHGLRHEILSADEVKRRFPALAPHEEMIAVWEPRAGILFPEACVESHLALARRYGATLRFNEPVTRWEPDGDGVRVLTTDGVFLGRRLVLAPGFARCFSTSTSHFLSSARSSIGSSPAPIASSSILSVVLSTSGNMRLEDFFTAFPI